MQIFVPVQLGSGQPSEVGLTRLGDGRWEIVYALPGSNVRWEGHSGRRTVTVEANTIYDLQAVAQATNGLRLELPR